MNKMNEKKKLKNGSDFRFKDFGIVILLLMSEDSRNRRDLREKDEFEIFEIVIVWSLQTILFVIVI